MLGQKIYVYIVSKEVRKFPYQNLLITLTLFIFLIWSGIRSRSWDWAVNSQGRRVIFRAEVNNNSIKGDYNWALKGRLEIIWVWQSHQLNSVQLCLTLCNSMDCSMPGFPVHCQLPELAQTHAHRVSDAISSSVVLFSCLQSFPASGSFPRSQFFASGGQSIEVSASASVFPMNIQDWFPLGLTGLISLQSKGLSKVFSNTTVQKHQLFGTELSL